MNANFLTLYIVLLGGLLAACQERGEDREKKQAETYGQFSYASPEGVISDGNYFYVSNVGAELNPMEKDGDGFILKVDRDMNIIEVFSAAEKLNAPRAMVIENDMLYVTDIDRVVGFHVLTGAKKVEYRFDDFGISFLSDISMKDSLHFFISARDENMVLQVNVNRGEYVVLPIPDLRRPNGLFYYAPRRELWVVEEGVDDEPNGRILKIDTESYEYEVVADIEGVFYGITVLIDHILLISDINTNSLHKVDMHANKVTRIDIENIRLPSSFYYDDSTGTLVGAGSESDNLVQVSVRHIR